MPIHENDITRHIVVSAIEVHKTLGPDLFVEIKTVDKINNASPAVRS